MFYRECPYCGCNLDPGEHCDCQEEKEMFYRKCNELLISEKDGQLMLKECA